MTTNSKTASISRVLEILSEPVILNTKFNNLADECGEIIAKYALSLDSAEQIDSSSSSASAMPLVVVAFKNSNTATSP